MRSVGLITTPFVRVPAVAVAVGSAARPLRPLIALLRATIARSAMLVTLVVTLVLFVPMFFAPRDLLASGAASLVVAAIATSLSYAALRSPAVSAATGLAANASLLATLVVPSLLLGLGWGLAFALAAMVLGAAIAGPVRVVAPATAGGVPPVAAERDTGVLYAIGCLGIVVLLFVAFVVATWVWQFTRE